MSAAISRPNNKKYRMNNFLACSACKKCKLISLADIRTYTGWLAFFKNLNSA